MYTKVWNVSKWLNSRCFDEEGSQFEETSPWPGIPGYGRCIFAFQHIALFYIISLSAVIQFQQGQFSRDDAKKCGSPKKHTRSR